MILRRLKAHIEKENWFAVAIDFCIVVIGVFIGIQVANWNQAKSDQRAAYASLESVLRDIESDIDSFESQKTFWMQVLQEGEKALSAKLDPSPSETEAWDVIRSFHNASHYDRVTFKQAAYTEFVNSGLFRLIEDQNLRDQVQQYYIIRGLGIVSDIPAYREHVRGLIPFEYNKYIVENCMTISIRGEHTFDDCPPPETAEEMVTLAQDLKTDLALRNNLRYAMSNAQIVEGILNQKIDEAETVANSIRHYLKD